MYAYQLNISDMVTSNFALQAGYGQRNTNWNDLIFGSRIDPNTGNTLPPNPQPANFNDNLSYLDFAGGILIGIDEKYFMPISELPTPETNRIGIMDIGREIDY